MGAGWVGWRVDCGGEGAVRHISYSSKGARRNKTGVANIGLTPALFAPSQALPRAAIVVTGHHGHDRRDAIFKSDRLKS